MIRPLTSLFTKREKPIAWVIQSDREWRTKITQAFMKLGYEVQTFSSFGEAENSLNSLRNEELIRPPKIFCSYLLGTSFPYAETNEIPKILELLQEKKIGHVIVSGAVSESSSQTDLVFNPEVKTYIQSGYP